MQSSQDLLNNVYLDLPALFRSSGDGVGIWKSIFLGQGNESASLRPYRPGDLERDIDRPSYDRFRMGISDEILTKQYKSERDIKIWIIVDMPSLFSVDGDVVSLHAKSARDSALLFSALIMGSAMLWDVPVGLVYHNGLDPEVTAQNHGVSHFIKILDGIQEIPLRDTINDVADLSGLREKMFGKPGRPLVFFVNDLSRPQKEYVDFMNEARVLYGSNLVPVLVDTSWVWKAIDRTFAISGQDSVSGKNVDIVTNKSGRDVLVQCAQKRVKEMRREFSHASFASIYLGEPGLEKFAEEITRCFMEKQRSR